MEKKNIYKESISVVFLILLLIIGDSIIKSNNNQEKISDKIYKSLNQIRDFHDSISSNQEKIISEIINNPNKSFLKDYNNFSSAKYLFSNDSLVYWSSDLNDPDNLYKKATSKINIYTEGNTTFLISKITQDSISLFTSTPLYYADQNKTNENKFLPTKLNGLYKINFFIENAEVEFQMDFTHKKRQKRATACCARIRCTPATSVSSPWAVSAASGWRRSVRIWISPPEVIVWIWVSVWSCPLQYLPT